MLIKSINKENIPNKYGFVLKTMQLEELLIDNDIDIHIDLTYWLPQIIGTIFNVEFWPPNYRIPYNRLYIMAGALLKDDIFPAREILKDIVLPEFVLWINNILTLPSNSTHSNHKLYFDATFNNNVLHIIK